MESALISPQELRRLFSYDPETGALTWTRRSPAMFTDGAQTAEHRCAIWNGRYDGAAALNVRLPTGYLCGRVNGKRVLAHRVVWAISFDRWPQFEIDHMNGDPSDNRIANLRDVPRRENARNLKVYSANKSGVSGVGRWHNGRWRAYISSSGSAIHLGSFESKADAVMARRAAEQALGYHENHGRRT